MYLAVNADIEGMQNDVLGKKNKFENREKPVKMADFVFFSDCQDCNARNKVGDKFSQRPFTYTNVLVVMIVTTQMQPVVL